MDTADSDSLPPQYHSYERQKCFIAYSEQAAWAEDLLVACQEVLQQPQFNLEADYARKHYVAEVSLRDKALELIANARYGIYDISLWQDDKGMWHEPRNVYIELGMAIAFNRPILLLRHARNREAGLELPSALAGLDKHVLEFSGYATLKARLIRELRRGVTEDPKQAWWNRYCHFGGRVCDYREAHPRARQWEGNHIRCYVADGSDLDQPDFRSVVENVLERFEDIEYSYLGEQRIVTGYQYLSCTHCQTVRSAPFAIYRITPCTSAETLVAIGISVALEKQFGYQIPKLLLADNLKDLPSLLAGYQVIVARNYQERKTKLHEFVPFVLRKVQEKLWKPRPLSFEEVIPSPVSDVIEQTLTITEELIETKLLERIFGRDSVLPEGLNAMEVDGQIEYRKRIRGVVEDVLDQLTPRESRILRLRYGLQDGQQRTLKEVGEMFGLSGERIRQIEADALRKMRQPAITQKIWAVLREDEDEVENNRFAKQFLNYEHEIALFREMVLSPSSLRVVYITGESGVGKSALLQRFIQICQEQHIRVIPINLRGGLSVSELEQVIIRQFNISPTSEPHTPFFQSELIDDLVRVKPRSVLIIDTFEQASQKIHEWTIRLAAETLMQQDSELRLVIAGQHVLDIQGAEVINLDAIAPEVWLKYLEAQGKEIPSEDPFSWLAGVISVAGGRTNLIAEVVNSLPDQR